MQNPLTGEILWHNPLEGYGVGVSHLASVRGRSSQTVVQQAAAADTEAANNAANDDP